MNIYEFAQRQIIFRTMKVKQYLSKGYFGKAEEMMGEVNKLMDAYKTIADITKLQEISPDLDRLNWHIIKVNGLVGLFKERAGLMGGLC